MIQKCIVDIDSDGHETVQHGNPAFPAACYLDEPEKDPSPWHWHEELEFNLVTQGVVTYHLNGIEKNLYPGEGAFVNSGIVHALLQGSEQACHLHSITFHPRLIGGSPESVYWQSYIQPLLNNDRAFGLFLSPSTAWQKIILTEMETAWQTALQEKPGFEFYFRNHLSLAMLETCSHIDSVPAIISEKEIRTQTRMRQMLSFVHEHFMETISLEDIAASAGLSKSEVLRCFHRSIHVTPMQYLKSFRLQRAASLLKNTNRRIIEIGINCGFQQINYFTRSFRELYGVSPREYRKQYLADQKVL